MSESLEDHVRRATRNFTDHLPEDQALALGLDLARELERAHAFDPPRFPDLEPAQVEMRDGHPSVSGGPPKGDERAALAALGALVEWLLTGVSPDVSWRLDGPPAAEGSTLRRRAVLRALASPGADGFASAREAALALERALAPEGKEPAPWPLFRGAPERAGTAAFLTAAAPSILAAAWHAPRGGVIASPLLTADLALVGTADGRLLVLDRATGALVHEGKLASAIESSAALTGRTLVTGTDDGEIVAVDILDGRIVYRVKLGEVVRSSPLALGDHLYVGAVEGKTLGSLLALDAATGKTVWKRTLGPVFSSPASGGGLLLVGSDDEHLHAVSPQKGELAWSTAMSAKVRATPAVLGEVAVVADFKGRVGAFAVKDGRPLWTLELGQPVYSSAALTPSLAVLGCHDGKVYGLALATGERVFSVATGGPVVSSPVARGDRFLAASTDGQLYLFDAAGKVLTRTAVAGEGVQSSPALDAAGLVVGSGRGVHAFRLTA